jgi:hypothetical protein
MKALLRADAWYNVTVDVIQMMIYGWWNSFEIFTWLLIQNLPAWHYHHLINTWSSYIIMMIIIITITIKTNIIICITSTVIINHSFTHISANPRRYLQLARYSSASNLDESYDCPDDENNRYLNYINYYHHHLYHIISNNLHLIYTQQHLHHHLTCKKCRARAICTVHLTIWLSARVDLFFRVLAVEL